eukprot:GHVU01021392.1.p1 GENE.GHVU01021392.1~~GHVU01021392.1.p1  ORF type:complete len:170 (+),score=22.84 GHVU01021392.1:419-928(+)
MFLFGGIDDRRQRFNDVHEFNFDRISWTIVATFGSPLPSPRTFHGCTVLDGGMWVFGGFDGAKRNDLYRLTIPDVCTRGQIRRTGRTSEVPLPVTSRAHLEQQVAELQRRLERELDKHLCKICFAREINVVFLPCKHRVVCSRCLKDGSAPLCYVCRAPVECSLETYTA